VVFWSFFEQAGTSMSLFTDRNVDRSLLGGLIPAAWFQSVNGLFILLLAPVFSWFWLYLSRRRLEPSTPLKFAFGIVLLGLGFAALYVGAETSRATGVVPMFWLILCYLLHSTGELCLSPIGLSMITKLAPRGVTGMLMGAWFLAISFAQYVAALIAQLTGVTTHGALTASPPKPTETAAPTKTPAPAQPVDGAQMLAAAMQKCGSEGLFSKFICEQKAFLQYCEEKWDKDPKCMRKGGER